MPKPIYVLSNKQKDAYARDRKLRYIGVPPIGSPTKFTRFAPVRGIIKPMQMGTRIFDYHMKTIGDVIEKAFPNTAGKIGRKLFDGVVKESAGRGAYHVDKLVNGDFDKNKKALGGQSTLTPNIVRGGKAFDLGNNLYYIQGRKHEQGGVDVGKDLEVEGGEVMQVKPNEVRVFSSVPFLRGSSPAQLVMGGVNPNKVFNAQEEFKDRNKINDDGTKKAKFGFRGLTRANYIIQQNKKIDDAKYKEYPQNVISKYPNTKENKEIIGKRPEKKLLNAKVIDGKITTNPLTIYLAEHPNIKKGLNIFTDILGTMLTAGAIKTNFKPKPIITKGYYKPNMIDYKTPHYPATIQKSNIKYNYQSTNKNVVDKMIDDIIIPEQLKLPNEQMLFENAIKVGRRPSTLSTKDNRNLNKIYDKVVGNKPHRGGYTYKHQPTEITYTPNTQNVKTYDATAEWNKYFGKYLYDKFSKKYGDKAMRKFMKEEKVSKYKCEGKYKANLGTEWNISYIPTNLFGSKYNKLVTLNNKGITRRDLSEVDIDNPNKSYADLIKENAFEGYSRLTDFGNNRLRFISTNNYNNIHDYNNVTNNTEENNTNISKSKSFKPKNILQQVVVNTGNKAYSTALRNSTRPSLASLVRTTELTRIPTIPGIASPETYQTKTKNKFWQVLTPEDYIGLGSNILGSIVGGILGSRNKKMPYVNLGEIEKPLTISAAKLKTNYNINPQLADINEQEIRGIADINRNSQSSQVALARKQRLRNAVQSAKNQLYGQKENIETELINRDALNRQQVRAQNASIYNQYLRDVYNNRLQQLENNRRTDLYNAEIDMSNIKSWINAISGINAGVQDTLQRVETRKAQERTLKAVAARNPDAKKVMDIILKNLI